MCYQQNTQRLTCYNLGFFLILKRSCENKTPPRQLKSSPRTSRLRKHIQSWQKLTFTEHCLWYFLSFFLLDSHTRCHAWLPNIYHPPTHPPPHSTCLLPQPQKTNSIPNLLQILTHYASCAAGSLSAEQSQQLFIIGLFECDFSYFYFSPVIIWRALAREWQILTAREKKKASKEEKSPYLCFAAIPPIIFSRLGKVCKYPWLELGCSSRFCASSFFFYPERCADQNVAFLSPLSPSRQMWSVLAESLHLHPRCQATHTAQHATSDSSFQIKTPSLICIAGGFYCGGSVAVFLVDASGCFDASPPASSGRHSGISSSSGSSSSSSGTALRRGGRPQRHAPLRLEKATSPWARETRGRMLLDVMLENTPLCCVSGRTWQAVEMVEM